MVSKREVILWLKEYLVQIELADKVESFIIGSFCNKQSSENDIDLLIIFDTKFSKRIAEISCNIRKEFKEKFLIPLHLLRLTYQEAGEHPGVINEIFAKKYFDLSPENHLTNQLT